jgi:hypothetical protein
MAETYAMYTYEPGNAEIGLAIQGRLLAVHFPSSGGSPKGTRNPDRRNAFEKLLGSLIEKYGQGIVDACRYGHLSTPVSHISKQLAGSGQEILRAKYQEGSNFRFEYWLQINRSLSVVQLAKDMGLTRGTSRPLEVLWPDQVQDVNSLLHRNAWCITDGRTLSHSSYSISIPIASELTKGIKTGDGLIACDPDKGVVAFTRIYRKRSTLEQTTLYFDAIKHLDSPVDPTELDFTVDLDSPAYRLQWEIFESAMKRATGLTLDALPVLTGSSGKEQAYLRDLLQSATVDDLLGPADGPLENIIGMSVRDRYLVGKLAPRDPIVSTDGPVDRTEFADGSDDTPEGAAPADLMPFAETGSGPQKAARRRMPGEEFSSTLSGSDPEEETDIEVSASKNQSFIPSSIGMTFCIDQSVEELEVDIRWGRYFRNHEHDYTRKIRRRDPDTDEETLSEVKERVWTRIPAGGKLIIPIKDGNINPQNLDSDAAGVVVQGSIREPLPTGDRLVTLFLVNDQQEPETNKDEAWVFQPEIIVRHPSGKAIFQRRPVTPGAESDFVEEAALEMIYRRRIEFGVGHNVAVHATPTDDNVELAVEVRTVVMPQYEVAITETPGLDPNDRSEMKRMLSEGYLDMKVLAEMERPRLLESLKVLTNDYSDWISEQESRIGAEIKEHDDAANAAISRCEKVLNRLVEGIKVLEMDDVALEAFRFANLAMADQRIRSIYSMRMRRGENPKLSELDKPKNRSWRPFQLAFVLLSIPGLADPTHPERTGLVDSVADLIWFPTGGGKTEAYLGVAAFTMGIRRMKPDLGDLDGSRGLSVIMRYTLRLLTLQQFQRATTLICAMEVLRRKDPEKLGTTPFTIGLWVGGKVTPNSTEASHAEIEAVRGNKRTTGSSPAQLMNCPWCGSEIAPGRDIEVRRFKSGVGQTVLFCGDKKGNCDFSRAKAQEYGLPVVVVDEELYRRPPSMMIATVDKFAMMAWKGEVRTLFGRASAECPRHGLLHSGSQCKGGHKKYGSLPAVSRKEIRALRPPDLIIQDEFHLISGPLGTMVGLYETAVDELSCWKLDGQVVRPKVVASTATVRKAQEQVNNVFLRQVGIFPPHGLDIEDNFFSVQRLIEEKPGRRYLGICAPGSARPAVLIRLYTALLTAGQELFDHFGSAVDPWMSVVGYFNSLRELGGMKRLAEDDVQTRCYRVQMSSVQRPGLAQRSVRIVDELTSRVSGKDIPKKLDQLEVPFKGVFDKEKGKWVVPWKKGDTRAIDIVLATNMLSVGVDVNRIGLMAVNGQPKNTAEYIQATSRVGRAFPGLVCTVLTWSRPRDLSHYETFEHYHATFYRHVEAQSVTPFAPRALDRGLTGTMVSWLRLNHDEYSPNLGASKMTATGLSEVAGVKDVVSGRGLRVTDRNDVKDMVHDMVAQRCDEWSKEVNKGGRRLGYQKGKTRKQGEGDIAGLLKQPGIHAWDRFTVPFSLREVEPGARLVMLDDSIDDAPDWQMPRPRNEEEGQND